MDQNQEEIKAQSESGPVTFVDDGSGGTFCQEIKEGIKQRLGQFNSLKIGIVNKDKDGNFN